MKERQRAMAALWMLCACIVGLVICVAWLSIENRHLRDKGCAGKAALGIGGE